MSDNDRIIRHERQAEAKRRNNAWTEPAYHPNMPRRTDAQILAADTSALVRKPDYPETTAQRIKRRLNAS